MKNNEETEMKTKSINAASVKNIMKEKYEM